MQETPVATPRTTDAVSTLYLTPPRADRLPEGRRLATPFLGDPAHHRPLATRGIHPDLIELMSPEGKERIGIGQVRQLVHDAQFSPTQAIRKVCLIPYAEQLTTEAANALLKILEEPPRDMAFILLTAHATDLLPTIVSRSRVVRMPPPEPTDDIARLVSAGAEPEDARWLVETATRPGELDRFLDSPCDLAALRRDAKAHAADLATADLVRTAVEDDAPVRCAALEQVCRRAANRDPELLTSGVRFLASTQREALFAFLYDLLSLCACRLRTIHAEPTASQAIDRDTRWLVHACEAIDTAHRSLSTYGPTEGILLSLFLSLGRSADAP